MIELKACLERAWICCLDSPANTSSLQMRDPIQAFTNVFSFSPQPGALCSSARNPPLIHRLFFDERKFLPSGPSSLINAEFHCLHTSAFCSFRSLLNQSRTMAHSCYLSHTAIACTSRYARGIIACTSRYARSIIACTTRYARVIHSMYYQVCKSH